MITLLRINSKLGCDYGSTYYEKVFSLQVMFAVSFAGFFEVDSSVYQC